MATGHLDSSKACGTEQSDKVRLTWLLGAIGGLLIASVANMAGAAGPGAPQPDVVKAWEGFNRQHDDRWTVRWNALTGAAQRISGYHLKLETTPTDENVEPLTRAVLSRLRPVLRIDLDQLELSKADYQPPANQGDGTWYVYYRQTYQGLPVEGGSVRLTVRDAQVTSIGSNFYPDIDLSPQPKLSLEQALERIRSTSTRHAHLWLSYFPQYAY